MGVTPVADGEIATIVTTLEMRARPLPRPIPPSPLRLVRWARPELAKYRTLFRRVGEPWLWYSRLKMDDATLAGLIHAPAIEVYAAVDRAGIEVGMVELDFSAANACEISYFALVPPLTGQGNGRWMMAETLARAWRPGIEWLWLHTCSLDHPSALDFYRASGFTPVSRAVESFPDPRLAGLLPMEAAPQIPLLTPAARQ